MTRDELKEKLKLNCNIHITDEILNQPQFISLSYHEIYNVFFGLFNEFNKRALTKTLYEENPFRYALKFIQGRANGKRTNMKIIKEFIEEYKKNKNLDPFIILRSAATYCEEADGAKLPKIYKAGEDIKENDIIYIGDDNKVYKMIVGVDYAK